MKIAIHAADLDNERIDGTRVYIYNLLKYFGDLSPQDEFLIYHKNSFNKALIPPKIRNYKIRKIKSFPFWTQTVFAWALWRDNPDVLWMPMHNLPLIRRKKLKTVVTVHDLAFKIFPQYFPKKDLYKINLLTEYSINNANALIAISNSTKKDIMNFYPNRKNKDINLVYHGFSWDVFCKEILPETENKILGEYGLKSGEYILYVGAIQPRKNLDTLVKAFEDIKKDYPNLKLVIAGVRAWCWENIIKKINQSRHAVDIIETGKISFNYQSVFYRNAKVFVFPELYAGFGIPILEAMASGVPVITANNSSLLEVGGDAAIYFKGDSRKDLVKKINILFKDDVLKESLIKKGKERSLFFSWQDCAQKTLNVIKATQ